MVRILPAILAKTEEEYRLTLDKVKSSPSLENTWIHIDLMDGKFVTDSSIDPEALLKYPAPFPKQVHLMVADPKDWLRKLVKFSPDQVIVHIENGQQELTSFFEFADSLDINIGLAMNPGTPLTKVFPLIDRIKSVLVMGVEPGKQGQQLIGSTLGKLAQFKEKGWNVELGVDGGVDSGNIKTLVDLGVNYVAVGSSLLKGDIDENLERLWEALYG